MNRKTERQDISKILGRLRGPSFIYRNMAIVLAVTPSVQLRRSVYVDKQHRRWGQHSSGTKVEKLVHGGPLFFFFFYLF